MGASTVGPDWTEPSSSPEQAAVTNAKCDGDSHRCARMLKFGSEHRVTVAIEVDLAQSLPLECPEFAAGQKGAAH